MRPPGVVVDAPIFDHFLSLLHAVEDLSVQAFVSELCSVIPASLQAEAMLLPFPCITAICRSFVTICSAPNRPLGMALLLPQAKFSHFARFRKGRSGQPNEFMSAFEGKAEIEVKTNYFRLWPLADTLAAPPNVRSWVNSGHRAEKSQHHSGHVPLDSFRSE
jgi:hypothetical protein